MTLPKPIANLHRTDTPMQFLPSLPPLPSDPTDASALIRCAESLVVNDQPGGG